LISAGFSFLFFQKKKKRKESATYARVGKKLCF
jgi:hypothetical protein